MEKQNSVAKVIRIIGFAIMVGGFMLAAVAGPGESEGDYNGGISLTALFSSFVTGMLFIGFSEVIFLLEKIHLRLLQKSPSDQSMSKNNNELELLHPQKEWQLSPLDLDAVQGLYPGQNIKIEASPIEDYCVVQIEGEDTIEVVEVGGFKPKKITDDLNPELMNTIRNWFSK